MSSATVTHSEIQLMATDLAPRMPCEGQIGSRQFASKKIQLEKVEASKRQVRKVKTMQEFSVNKYFRDTQK